MSRRPAFLATKRARAFLGRMHTDEKNNRRLSERRALPPHVRELLTDLDREMRRPGAIANGIPYRGVPLELLQRAALIIRHCYKPEE